MSAGVAARASDGGPAVLDRSSRGRAEPEEEANMQGARHDTSQSRSRLARYVRLMREDGPGPLAVLRRRPRVRTGSAMSRLLRAARGRAS